MTNPHHNDNDNNNKRQLERGEMQQYCHVDRYSVKGILRFGLRLIVVLVVVVLVVVAVVVLEEPTVLGATKTTTTTTTLATITTTTELKSYQNHGGTIRALSSGGSVVHNSTTQQKTNVSSWHKQKDEHNDDVAEVSGDTIVILSILSIVNTLVFVLPTSIRYAIQKNRCVQQGTRRNNNNSCICTVEQLQQAMTALPSTGSTDIEVLLICPAIALEFTEEIDMTGRAFRIKCVISRFVNTGPCIFTTTTTTTTRFFSGAPRDGAFQDITFANGGTATNGGAILLASGGNVIFHDVTFQNNVAAEKGGALYVSNGANVQLFGTTTFRDNTATGSGGGNDVYIAKSNFFGFVQCEPSSRLRNRPAFCDGVSGLVVEGATTMTQQAGYTDCVDDSLVDYKC